MSKDYIHSEVLKEQAMLDFENYKMIIGLINAYVQELTNEFNDKSFEERMELLRNLDQEGN